MLLRLRTLIGLAYWNNCTLPKTPPNTKYESHIVDERLLPRPEGSYPTGRAASRIRSILYSHTSNMFSLGERDLGSILYIHGQQRGTDVDVNIPEGEELMSASRETTGTANCDGVSLPSLPPP